MTKPSQAALRTALLAQSSTASWWLLVRASPLAVIAAMASSVSYAAEPSNGLYVGVGGGQSVFRSDIPSQINAAYEGSGFTVESASVTDNKDGAWKLYGGLRFHRYGAIEIGYLDFGQATTEYAIGVPNQGVAHRDGKYRLTGFEASAVGIYPIADRGNIFGKVGVLVSKLKYSENGTNQFAEPTSFSASNNASRFLWGAGGSFDFTDNLSARLEWQRAERIGNTFALNENGNGRFDQVDLFSLNLQWQFR